MEFAPSTGVNSAVGCTFYLSVLSEGITEAWGGGKCEHIDFVHADSKLSVSLWVEWYPHSPCLLLYVEVETQSVSLFGDRVFTEAKSSKNEVIRVDCHPMCLASL